MMNKISMNTERLEKLKTQLSGLSTVDGVDHESDLGRFLAKVRNEKLPSAKTLFQPPENYFPELKSAGLTWLAQYIAGRTTKPCESCKAVIEYYPSLPWEAGPPRSASWEDEDGRRPTWGTPRPKHCDPCTARIGRDNGLNRFKRQNPGAAHYLKLSGNPPKPEQYAAVVGFDLFEPNGKNNLVIIGGSYQGKTTAVYHLAAKYAQDGLEVRFVGHDELNDIPDLARSGDLKVRDFMDDLKEVDLLVLDDLDKVNITPRIASEIFSLIESRHRCENPGNTIITMNVRSKRAFVTMFSKTKKEDDARKYGESIYNRLQESFQFFDFDV